MSLTKLTTTSYTVFHGEGSLKALSAFLKKQSYSSYFILCDENTLQKCLPQLVTACSELASAEIIEIESGELSKSLEVSANIWQTFIDNKADKHSLLINLGGGVVSDLGGFTASVYKRGIDFIHVPTSLLAMADASIGGKTGIDFNGLKNTIGSFAQPKAVFVYPHFLTSLSERHFQNGLAEIYKIALIADKKFWKQLDQQSCEINELILRSIQLKNTIVHHDPHDKGKRKTLNFGHSMGHAIESLFLNTPGNLLHGEAVVIGMIMESHIAFQKKLITKKVLQEICFVLGSSFYSPAIDPSALGPILNNLKQDKKTKHKKLLFALITGIGSCKYDVEVSEAQIKKAFHYYNSINQ